MGQLVPDHDALQARVDPLIAVAERAILLAHAVGGKLRILHLLQAFAPDLGQPLFERLGLGAGNALDDAQQRLLIGCVGQALLAVRRFHFQLLTF